MTARPRCATRSIGPSRRSSGRPAPPPPRSRPPARARPAPTPFGHATAARWDLHGVLAPLADADLDADPGGGEWTIRQTLAHIVHVQRAYPAFASWWLSREQTAELPASIPDGVDEGFPEEEAEGAGTLAEIRARLDDAMDGAAERMAALDEAQLATPGPLVGLCGRCRLPARTHVLAPPGAHGPGRQDPRHARSVAAGGASARPPRVPRVRPARSGRLRAAVEAMADAGRAPLEEAVTEAADAFGHVRLPSSVTDFGH